MLSSWSIEMEQAIQGNPLHPAYTTVDVSKIAVCIKVANILQHAKIRTQCKPIYTACIMNNCYYDCGNFKLKHVNRSPNHTSKWNSYCIPYGADAGNRCEKHTETAILDWEQKVNRKGWWCWKANYRCAAHLFTEVLIKAHPIDLVSKLKSGSCCIHQLVKMPYPQCSSRFCYYAKLSSECYWIIML